MSAYQIEIVEVGPRDGLQNEPEVWPVRARLDFIALARAAGVNRIEAGSFVNPAKVPQMAGSEEVFAALPAPRDGFIALALNPKGVRRALAAGAREINYALAATDAFSIRNAGVDVAGSLGPWEEAAAEAKAAGVALTATISTVFGCPFEGEVASAKVEALVERVARAGPDEIALADTIGVAAPNEVKARFAAARVVAGPGPRLRAHFHNTRNTGIANAVAAVEAGVTILDGSLAGIGGCPFAPGAAGNTPTEDLVYVFERMGLRTGIDLDAAIAAARFVSGKLGRATPGMLSKAGNWP